MIRKLTGALLLALLCLAPAVAAPSVAQTATKTYTCPMHPEVVASKAGTCPKCKMKLVEKPGATSAYVCPMHSDVKSDKPGNCPKCKMALVKKPAK